VGTFIPSFTGRFENKRNAVKPRSLREPPDAVLTFKTKSHLEMAMAKLFFVNIPYNCSDRELQEWVESRGVETRSIRIVRDLVAGVSPAFGYVELKDESKMQEAISILNGKKLRSQTILVKEAQTPVMGAAYSERKSA
jgi:RNA recognition motif-containing protein